jgi:hypothetical protein
MCIQRLLQEVELLEVKLSKVSINSIEELGMYLMNIMIAKQVTSWLKASTSTPA